MDCFMERAVDVVNQAKTGAAALRRPHHPGACGARLRDPGAPREQTERAIRCEDWQIHL